MAIETQNQEDEGFEASELIGLTVPEANAIVEAFGYHIRITRKDGQACIGRAIIALTG